MTYSIPHFIHIYKRFIFIGMSVVLFILLFMLGNGAKEVHPSAETHNVKYFKCIVVDDGDTLTSIAKENITSEYESIQKYIAEVKSINGLSDDLILSGGTLVVPYYASPVSDMP